MELELDLTEEEQKRLESIAKAMGLSDLSEAVFILINDKYDALQGDQAQVD